jgi:hypothetical protein
MRGISYWILPLISAVAWLGISPQLPPIALSKLMFFLVLVTLLVLLIRWTTTGSPHYSSMGNKQHIAYISNIGAEDLKPLFIVGCCITTLALDASFLAERYLRHKGRLARNMALSEKVFAGLSIAFASIGTAGLILLSIFDTKRHRRLHRLFLLLFM